MAIKLKSSKKYFGVFFAPSLNKWRAQIGKNSKLVIGDFATELESAKAVNSHLIARDGHNGGFLLSRINFIAEEIG